MTDLQIGAIDGAAELTTRGFEVVLDDTATVQLDDLIVTRQTLPSGEEVAHYGIVTEQTGRIEGAELPSDTRHIALAQTMPGQISRSVAGQRSAHRPREVGRARHQARSSSAP